MAKILGFFTLVLLLSGCGSRPGIPVSDAQPLVMEGAVLAAGIRASHPTLTQRDGSTVARSSLYNEQQHPVQLYYRFYWYDSKGLEIPSADPMQVLTIAPESGAEVQSGATTPEARKVRLYLSLRSEH